MFTSLQRLDLGLDLGTSKFSICSRSEGVLCSEPAYIAFDLSPKGRSRIIAVGREAESMLGKTPPGIQVLRPMRDGIIVHSELAVQLLQTLFKSLRLHRFVRRHRHLLVGRILGASSIEQKAFFDVARALGASSIKTIEEPLAAAVGSHLSIDDPHGHLLLDVGSGVSEVVIVSLGRIIAGKSIRVGGESMDRAIIGWMMKRHGLIISAATARKAKEQLSQAPDSLVVLHGFHHLDRRPFEISISSCELLAAIQPAILQIVAMIKSMLEELTPELAVDVIESGLHLSGGGAYTASLREELENQTQLDVHLTDDPGGAVVRGCHSMLSYFKYVG